MDRKTELLIATWKLLNKQKESDFVMDLLNETVYYDGTDCDGSCLMEDIEMELYDNGIDVSDFNE